MQIYYLTSNSTNKIKSISANTGNPIVKETCAELAVSDTAAFTQLAEAAKKELNK